MFCIDNNKSNAREKVFSITTFLFIVFAVFMVYFIIGNSESLAYNKLKVLGILGWFVLIIFLILYKHITNVFITPSTILVLSMFAFSYGQILLYGLGVKYDYFFQNSYYSFLYGNDVNILLSGNFYTLICLSVFCLGILISIKARIGESIPKNIKFDAPMGDAFLIMFIASAIPYLAYNAYLAFYSLSHGYSKTLDLTQPSIIRYIGVFFLPSAIGSIISCKNNRNLKRFIIFCTIINCVCAFIIGGRSLAFGLIIGLVIILMLNKELSGKTVFLMCLGAFILATISVSVAEYRSDHVSFISIMIDNMLYKNVLIQFLGEAGFSGTSIVWTMKIVQSGYETFDGMTYVGAVFKMIPSSLDIFNILTFFDQYTQLEGILTEYFSFNFGVGFSLVAESYINFKWFGVVPIFFEAIIFGRLLNLEKKDNVWKIYVSVVMMIVLLTIPRRDIVFLSNQITLCVIFPYIFIKVVKALFYKDACFHKYDEQ